MRKIRRTGKYLVGLNAYVRAKLLNSRIVSDRLLCRDELLHGYTRLDTLGKHLDGIDDDPCALHGYLDHVAGTRDSIDQGSLSLAGNHDRSVRLDFSELLDARRDAKDLEDI